MPDIDTDFDDEGRQKVLDYVVEKYGKQQVAQIVTYGTMAAKMSIKDVARVLDLPLDQSNALAKLVPEKPGISLKRVLTAPLDGEGIAARKGKPLSDDIENAKKLREYLDAEGTPRKPGAQRSHDARRLGAQHGHPRGRYHHRAQRPHGNHSGLYVQRNRSAHHPVRRQHHRRRRRHQNGLSGPQNPHHHPRRLRLIEQNHGLKIDIDAIPLDDRKTYELYQRGETNGTFQFESAGMQKYLRDLKPDKFDDLIAMNALYRPGPLEYIPDFIARKHGRQQVTYDLPEMEEYLADTIGIAFTRNKSCFSQKLAGFSKGDADVLRKAMGKKQKAVLDKMKGQFLEGAMAKGMPKDKLEKVWTDWEAFASYAFNKSHSTCYAFVAYQTAYLKAHYPSEYMASVLTHSQGNIEKTTFFLEECKRMGLDVKGPDVNESGVNFSVNKKGDIRYGMGAVKGVGEAAVEVLIQERKNGPFTTIFDFMRRINLRTVNKKVMESLAFAGAFDEIPPLQGQRRRPRGVFCALRQVRVLHRTPAEIRRRAPGRQNHVDQFAVRRPVRQRQHPRTAVPKVAPWNLLTLLQREKDVVGIYLSGHPLDDYKFEVENLTTCPLDRIENSGAKN
jgi:DNA polymerase-3 subunit alpha